MDTHRSMMKQAVDKYLTEARDHGLTPSGTGPIRGPLMDTFDALDAYAEAQAKVRADAHLSPEGKRDRLAKLETDTRSSVTSHLVTARRRLDDTRKFHETKAKLPRVEGADLMGARHDVDRLTARTKPGELAERLRFAVQNGGDAVRDLLLGDNYAERVILPAGGPDYAPDAATWAVTKRRLIAEHLGEAGAPHLQALDAAHTAAKAVTITEHVAHHDLGPAPEGGDGGAPA